MIRDALLVREDSGMLDRPGGYGRERPSILCAKLVGGTTDVSGTQNDFVEEWTEIRNHPNYLISSWGRVYSFKSDLIMTPRPSEWGYMRICLYDDGNRYWKYIHRLVAEHFIPGGDEGLEVNHIDGDKTYNNETNLEWVTKRMNNQHAWDTGLAVGNVISMKDDTTGIIYKSIIECSRDLDLSYPAVRYALRYGTKTKTGKTFSYVN